MAHDFSQGPVLDQGDLATVELREDDGVYVAAVEGEVDISNVEMVGGIVTRLPNQALGLVVDLSKVSYIDSSGISMLHNLATRLGQRSQGLVVVCRRPSSPYRVLTLTGFDARAPVVEGMGEALGLVRDAGA